MTDRDMACRRLLGIALAAVLACLAAGSCIRTPDKGDFTEAELALINGSDSLMHVLTIADSLEQAVLRAVSTDLSARALRSGGYAQLARRMVTTVTHPSQDGVGIAGPQVGLNRRVVAVQRFDKPREPFEVYPNVRIVWASDSLAYGPEGCLSVPDRRGDVLRSTEIVIEYADMESLLNSRGSSIPVIRDTVRGFTAVIFQHETDHLDGILYTDRLESRTFGAFGVVSRHLRSGSEEPVPACSVLPHSPFAPYLLIIKDFRADGSVKSPTHIYATDYPSAY